MVAALPARPAHYIRTQDGARTQERPVGAAPEGIMATRLFVWTRRSGGVAWRADCRILHLQGKETLMTVAGIAGVLEKRARELYRGIPVEWRYSLKKPADPLSAEPEASWPKFDRRAAGPWKKNGKNWFYGEIVVPMHHHGVPLNNAEGLLFIHGWMPFTLWLDGSELYREKHAWMATGPIADPFPVKLTPGSRHKLVTCIEPTELPANTISLNVELRFTQSVEIAVEIAAAAAQLRYAEAIASSASDRDAVARAARRVDVKAVENGQWAKALRSIAAMEKMLSRFEKRARSMTVHIIGHSHIDMDWMWTWPDTVHCIRRDFKSVTDMMDEYPELTFTHSQVSTYEVVRKSDPDVFRKVRERIREGRWENAAGTWVEGDLNMADGESIARHMLYAADWTCSHLDSKARVLWEPDTFGHPGNMPQLARLGEFDCYFHMRGNPGWHNNWPYHEWKGIDGTSIPALSIGYNGDLHPEAVVHHLLMFRRFGFRNALHIWGIGDHGGAVSRYQMGILNQYRHKPV
ncbi:MAG TPA: hypothetical protein ENN09_05990, partial [Planctomycetes bacterium]|nr:hypothetical protein [Planctomycetota bacterium]